MDTDDYVAIRSKKNGLYYPNWTTKPNYYPIHQARAIIRIDMGKDLKDFDLLTKDEVVAMRTLK